MPLCFHFGDPSMTHQAAKTRSGTVSVSRLSLATLLLSVSACGNEGTAALDEEPPEVTTLEQNSALVFAEGKRAINAKKAEYDNSILALTPDGPAFPLSYGVAQSFSQNNALIVWSPSTGAHPIWNLFLRVWERGGYATSVEVFGFPTDDATNIGDPRKYCLSASPNMEQCQYYSNGYAICRDKRTVAILCDGQFTLGR